MRLDAGIVKIGILEDDPQVRNLIQHFLLNQRFVVQTLRNGTHALDAVKADAIDLLLLDLGLPGEDGLDVLRRIRALSRIPILIVSGRAETFTVTCGLDAGADDYVTKPIVFEELGARVRSVLRRAGGRPAGESAAVPAMRVGGVEIDIARNRISGPLGAQPLTERETLILSLLLGAEGRPVSREALTRATMGRAWDMSVRTLDVHVSNIRRKLMRAGIESDPVQTIRNVGYRLTPQPKPSTHAGDH